MPQVRSTSERKQLEEATAAYFCSCRAHGVAKDKFVPFWEKRQTIVRNVWAEVKREEAATSRLP